MRRVARLALTLALVASAGCGGSGAKATAVHTALLYGDSLTWEAAVNNTLCPHGTACHRETVQAIASGHPSLRLVVRSFPGVAPCDWLKSLRGDLATYKPEVVMLQTEGNDLTPCMHDPATGSLYPVASAGFYDKYRSDLDAFFGDVTATGAKMIVVPPIVTNDRKFNEQVTALGRIVTRAAARFPRSATTSLPQDAVTDNGRFTSAKSCLAGETAAKGCKNGRIRVRDPVGFHFCPVGLKLPAHCSVYSSGALRFGESMVEVLVSATRDS
jgi:hypothetical protein